MNRFWKWSLTILGILVVLALIAVPFALHYISGFGMGRSVGYGHPPMMQDQRGFEFDGGPGPMMNNRGWGGPMMHGRGFSPFFGGFALLGGLFRLAFFGLLLFGAYWLGKRNARVVIDPSRNPPLTPAPTPIMDPVETPDRGRKVANSE